jgi:PAS domain S-box-containing protein
MGSAVGVRAAFAVRVGLLWMWLIHAVVLPARGAESGAGVAPVSPGGGSEPLPLSTLESVGSLTVVEANRGMPFLGTVVVTYCHPQWGMLFVRGENGGTYISIPTDTPGLRPGDVVEVEGRTSGRQGYPEIELIRLRPTGGRRVPLLAEAWTAAQLFAGDHSISARWIEVEGVVLGVLGREGRIQMYLQVGAQVLPVFLLQGTLEEARGWMDARVRVAGVASLVHGADGKLTGVALLAQESSQVRVEVPAHPALRDLSVIPIGRIQASADGTARRRVHVQGTLDQRLSPTRLWIRDPTGSIEVHGAFPSEDVLESPVDVLGYVTQTNDLVFLDRAAVLPLVRPVVPSSDAGPGLPPLDPTLPTLVDARSVHRLSRVEAARGYPVRFEAVVTYSDPRWWLLFVQDATDGMYVVPRDNRVELVAGQRVVVSGRTAPGAFAPIVTDAVFESLGMGRLPAPVAASPGELLSGQYDCGWVRLPGIVQSAKLEEGRHTLFVRSRGAVIPAFLPPSIDAATVDGLIEAQVTLDGALGSVLNADGQLVGIRLHVPDVASIQVVVPAPKDGFGLRADSIGDLLRYDPSRDERRTRVVGVLTSLAPDGTVSLQDGSGGMLIRIADRPGDLRVGDRVEISGFPSLGVESPTLLDARIRSVGPGEELVPADVPAEEILVGRHAAELVRLSARLIEDVVVAPGASFVLQSGGVVFDAVLPARAGPSWGSGSRLRSGSRLAITGICRVRRAPAGQVKSFQVILRNEQDLEVLETPPWLSVRQMAWVLGGVGGSGAIALAWMLLLARKNRELREGEDRVRTILNHLQTGIVVIAAEDHSIVEANPVALALAGRSVAEVVGRPCAELLPGIGCGPGPGSRDGRVVQGVEDTLLRADGSRVPVLRNAVPLQLDGRPHLLVSFVDVSERHAVQAALQQAKAEAEAASEAKSRFLALMSHEIRTPLNGVVGVLRLLPGEPLTQRQQRWIGMALSSADTLLRVIRDILDFSKIEAGRLELEVRPVDLHAVIADAAAPYAEKIRAKGLGWDLSIHTAVPRHFRADADRLAQVIGNLLSNACKFTDSGSVALLVSVAAADPMRPVVQFAVADTGMGLTAEQQRQLFLPFSQVDASASRRFEGTGLGLRICRELAELMGGRVGVHSEHGRGSTFWLELPLEVTDPGSVEAAGRGSGLGPGVAGVYESATRPVTGRVLLAEDNEINREIAQAMILATGCPCDCVEDGGLAVAAVGTGTYDLVFMDCMMPGIDGYAATRSIRAEEARLGVARRLPIVAMTAKAMKGDRERCLEAGMDDYLCKPLDPEGVAAMIGKWLGPAGGGGQATDPRKG